MGGVDICKIKWSFYEVFWRSSSPSTVPVQQRTPGKEGKGFFYLTGVGTLYAGGIFRENDAIIYYG